MRSARPRHSRRRRFLGPLACFPALPADLVQRRADTIVVQDLFGFGPSMLEAKFALNVRKVTKISGKRQLVRHDTTVFFAVVDHTVVHSTEFGPLKNAAVALVNFN